MLSTPKTSAAQQQLDQLLHSHSNALFDCIVAIYKDAKALPEIPSFLKQCTSSDLFYSLSSTKLIPPPTTVEPIYNDIARLRINKDDFEHIRPLARGQFAQVMKLKLRISAFLI